MPLLVLVILSLHILAATFWAGTSFTLARTEGAGGEILFRPQMGAALIAVLAGGYLWHELHAGGFGTDEQVLGLGALCALVAAGVQGIVSGRAVSALRRGETSDAEARSRIAIGQRIGAALLAVALICMAVARYV
jgi:hypothetical protein